jgi:hypothetical protein
MSDSEIAKFTASINAAWNELHSFLSAITPSQASKQDQAGWSVKDHVAHLAVWEDSVAILFREGRRHEALGIEESLYTAGSFDEINERIRVRVEGTTLQEAVRKLEGAHKRLMGHLGTLRDADLEAKASEFFPQAPRNDDRALASLIWANTGGHFTEHLDWMRDLIGRAD